MLVQLVLMLVCGIYKTTNNGDVLLELFHLNLFFMSLFSRYMFIKHGKYITLLKKDITYPDRCSPVNLRHICETIFLTTRLGDCFRLVSVCISKKIPAAYYNIYYQLNIYHGEMKSFSAVFKLLLAHFKPVFYFNIHYARKTAEKRTDFC